MNERRKGRRMSVVLVPAEAERARTIEISYKRLSVLMSVVALVALGLAAAVVSWLPLYRRASQASVLARQVDSLVAIQPDVQELATQLIELEQRQAQFRVLFGHVEPPEVRLWQLSSAPAGGLEEAANETEIAPSAWPLASAGFVTQSLLEGAAGGHPGIDIAVPTDSYIRASGAGEVIEAAEDSVYGLFVRIDHGDGLQSLYGHASQLVVESGMRVRRGEVIAMSGSTGRSTAAHLHFEILKDGRPVDPLTLVVPP